MSIYKELYRDCSRVGGAIPRVQRSHTTTVHASKVGANLHRNPHFKEAVFYPSPDCANGALLALVGVVNILCAGHAPPLKTSLTSVGLLSLPARKVVISGPLPSRNSGLMHGIVESSGGPFDVARRADF